MAQAHTQWDHDRALAQVINLFLAPGTRDWERDQLRRAKQQLEQGMRPSAALATLEAALRPLALRDNLTPDVADFYQALTDTAPAQFDLSPFYAPDAPDQARAIFAGGCFWCMVEPFDQRPGIRYVLSGYTGGPGGAPTYEQVASNATGHVEAVEILYDPRQITYQALLDLYWSLIDPFDGNGQFQDRGARYRPMIFPLDAEQEAAARAKVAAAQAQTQRPIAVAVTPAGPFWPAENRHQDFYKKQPKRYRAVLRARQQLMAMQRRVK
ncbi:peptide-methionine (S)-S-oxide reductase MsrA [Lacticaseibacillus absianus]|uniref:peptide-methionine (S)-S-oxide reductase MsrA n=1 Tax=Lacticaseibacillus absianus TaxID=2729623 RepID=UPI0015C9742D|nr:peptide-methionine (S)-S-oxide reductase MsrA [Lacticaseibacillus absianus]